MTWNTTAPDGPPTGCHQVEIVHAVDGASKSSGKPMTTVTFEIIEGPHQGEWVRDYFVKSVPFARKRMKELLNAVDLGDQSAMESTQLVGRTLIVELTIEEYKKRRYPKVHAYSRLQNGSFSTAQETSQKDSEHDL